jgi:hypothetical protein
MSLVVLHDSAVDCPSISIPVALITIPLTCSSPASGSRHSVPAPVGPQLRFRAQTPSHQSAPVSAMVSAPVPMNAWASAPTLTATAFPTHPSMTRSATSLRSLSLLFPSVRGLCPYPKRLLRLGLLIRHIILLSPFRIRPFPLVVRSLRASNPIPIFLSNRSLSSHRHIQILILGWITFGDVCGKVTSETHR